ncbi:hypothetical protein PGT21_034664 [Puccinia graminis f. sp. tritici]|uniref:Uncharacterized protein n=1 Tax=Puccinia graminis f. sp. tritici TaxID=56615 RepID=A0A5B0MPH5_PUCGR|nr:hypothetical protein PGT21_033642 [Puccinia graminis f. sp. tritici]KAA1078402.1 hypothetical protein PGT21_034664 [Puccinia graminis f. sp. tritici]KAA1107000.1 hypothetical protein PGTUg99_021523 [Puccinia graminis f. sp. tritici]KAA1120360.1 hypothetical protein PGTUg99_018770 [Puccinia graminis f. sp. tritici]
MFCNLTPRAVNLMIGQRDPHQPHTRVISEIFSAIEKLERWVGQRSGDKLIGSNVQGVK